MRSTVIAALTIGATGSTVACSAFPLIGAAKETDAVNQVIGDAGFIVKSLIEDKDISIKDALTVIAAASQGKKFTRDGDLSRASNNDSLESGGSATDSLDSKSPKTSTETDSVDVSSDSGDKQTGGEPTSPTLDLKQTSGSEPETENIPKNPSVKDSDEGTDSGSLPDTDEDPTGGSTKSEHATLQPSGGSSPEPVNSDNEELLQTNSGDQSNDDLMPTNSNQLAVPKEDGSLQTSESGLAGVETEGDVKVTSSQVDSGQSIQESTVVIESQPKKPSLKSNNDDQSSGENDKANLSETKDVGDQSNTGITNLQNPESPEIAGETGVSSEPKTLETKSVGNLDSENVKAQPQQAITRMAHKKVPQTNSSVQTPKTSTNQNENSFSTDNASPAVGSSDAKSVERSVKKGLTTSSKVTRIQSKVDSMVTTTSWSKPKFRSGGYQIDVKVIKVNKEQFKAEMKKKTYATQRDRSFAWLTNMGIPGFGQY